MIQSSFKWGFLLGFLTSLGTQILTWLGLGLTNWFVLLTYFLVIVIIGCAVKGWKKYPEPRPGFINILLGVLIAVLLARLIFQAYMYIYIFHVYPTWVDDVAVTWTDSLRQSGAEESTINSMISSFRQAWEPLNIFTIELVKFGVPQFILGGIIAALVWFLPFKRSQG